MPTANAYLNWITSKVPPWLSKRFGLAMNQTFGILADALAQATTEAVKSRFLSLCPIDALQYAGAERGIPKSPGETDEQYRQRLLVTWTTWQQAGTPKAIIASMNVVGLSNVVVYEQKVDNASATDPRPFVWDRYGHEPSKWYRFWVVINPPHLFTPPPLPIGLSLIVGALSLGSTILVGFGGSPSWTRGQLDYLRLIVRLWKPSHATCDQIIVLFSGALVGTGQSVGSSLIVGGNAAYVPPTA